MSRAGLVGWMFLLAACGSDAGESNVAACEGYVDAMVAIECGETDFSALFPEGYCEPYRESMCDMAPYFDCLKGSAQCDESGELLEIDATACETEANCDNL
jgi:hypothetical protein